MGKAIILENVSFADKNIGKVTLKTDIPLKWSLEARGTRSNAVGEIGGLGWLTSNKWILYIKAYGSTYKKAQNMFALFNSTDYNGFWVGIPPSPADPNAHVCIGQPAMSSTGYVGLSYSDFTDNNIKFAIKFNGTAFYYTTNGTTWTQFATWANIQAYGINTALLASGAGTSTNFGDADFMLFDSIDFDISYLWEED